MARFPASVAGVCYQIKASLHEPLEMFTNGSLNTGNKYGILLSRNKYGMRL